MIRQAALILAARILLGAYGVAGPAGPAGPAQSAGTWSTFEGTWSATGARETLPTEAAGEAAVVQLSGAVVLTTGTGLAGGFRAQAIGFDDGRAVSAGRAVWTDSRGDRIFSELKGEPLQTGRRVHGIFTGGTGRYAGLVGDYELTWQYVVHGDDDAVQGRAVDLRGRFRRAGAP
jgi:hypothetical protein